MDHIGIDVPKKESQLCIPGAAGELRTRTRYISVIRALLRQHGWRVPTGSAEGFIRCVLALRVPGRLLSELAPLLAVMRQVNQQLAYSAERIAAVARADESRVAVADRPVRRAGHGRRVRGRAR